MIARYSDHAEKYYAKGGTIHNIRRACSELAELYGRTQAANFGPLALKALRQRFVDAGLARTHCNRLTDFIRRMFKWAAGEQLVPVATWQALTSVPGLRFGHTDAHENAPVAPIDDVTVEATLPHMSPTVAAMVRLQRLTGMRPDEVCRLRPCEVDRTGDVWSYRPEHHKTVHRGKGRVIFIGPKAQDVLRRFLVRDAGSYCFVPAEVVLADREARHAARQTPLSCGNRPGYRPPSRRARRGAKSRPPGQQYTTISYRRAIHRACDKADLRAHEQQPEVATNKRIIPRWSPNRLRHTAATEIRRRFGLEAAQVVLGHSMADVTQIYTERDLAKAAAVIREVG